jgi:hypothetical protein
MDIKGANLYLESREWCGNGWNLSLNTSSPHDKPHNNVELKIHMSHPLYETLWYARVPHFELEAQGVPIKTGHTSFMRGNTLRFTWKWDREASERELVQGMVDFLNQDFKDIKPSTRAEQEYLAGV